MTCPRCGKQHPDAGPGVFECDCGARFWRPPLCWHRAPNKAGTRPHTWHRLEEPCPGEPWRET